MIFAGFSYFLWLLQTVESATTQSQNNLPSKETTCNINNYYSFHAGPKLEKIIEEMKTKLEAIAQELKNLSKKEETRKKVPDPVAFFPLNAAHGTKEIKNRAVKGIPRGVTLAPGPDGRPNYSYKFSGSSNSYIEFPNWIGGPLDVRYSMTILCWVYYDGKGGPLFNYEKGSTWGVHFWVTRSGNLFVLFNRRDYSSTKSLSVHASLVGGWKFVGTSYDRCSGEAKLWVNGAAVQTLNIGAGLELATQDVIRMGVRSGDGRCFKGKIAQMRIYNRALSQEQIQAIQKLAAA